LTALAVLIGGAAWFKTAHQPLHYPPGIQIPGAPAQSELPSPQPAFEKAGWTLKPVAGYVIEARILGKKRYTGDATAPLSPFDLALGWGQMSDESVLERLDISQGGRFYHWQYWGNAPLPEKDIVTHSANVHVIPADGAAGARIASLRVGALVKLNGWLVDATHPKGDRPWRSSLTRDDEGEGACEIFYVRSVTELAPRH
jgi:hypothetical protein